MKHNKLYRKDIDVVGDPGDTTTETETTDPVAPVTETAAEEAPEKPGSPALAWSPDYSAGYNAGVEDGRKQEREEFSKRASAGGESLRGILTLLKDEPSSPVTANERIFLDRVLKQLEEVPA